MFVSKKSLQKTFIKEISTIKDCVYSLNASGLQIANVVNDKGELIGTITDGDIRRGLLNGLGLKSPIKKMESVTIRKINEKIYIRFISKSFLQNQVRSMVGCLKYLSIGRWSITEFRNIMRSKKRSKCAPPAPSEGLYLMDVKY